MPEFIPSYLPNNLDDVTRGYLAAAEWLFHETDDYGCDVDPPRRVRGWSAAAVRQAKKDCKAFVVANAADLALYATQREAELRGRDYTIDECIGYDLWLSRNGHGAGFFDRGSHMCFDRLQDACRGLGEADMYRTNSGWLVFE